METLDTAYGDAMQVAAATGRQCLFGICANCTEPDTAFRMGAKAWIAHGTDGDLERFQWIAASKRGRQVEKWAPTMRFSNFRAKWIPDHLVGQVTSMVFGSRDEAQAAAARLEEFAASQRSLHPGRRLPEAGLEDAKTASEGHCGAP